MVRKEFILILETELDIDEVRECIDIALTDHGEIIDLKEENK
jgi:hypothetical protein